MSQNTQNKWMVVTGANTGIGEVTALELARGGALVTLACRNEDRARAAMERIRAEVPAAQLEFLALDLGDLGAVRQSVTELLARREQPIDVLVNNAGLAGLRGKTADGFEIQFGVNHLGHFLWTLLLLDRIRQAPEPRVVNVASRAHTRVKGGIPWERLREETLSSSGWPEYCVSKLCNVLFTRELAGRCPDVRTYAVHPGVVASDIWRRVPGPLRWLMKLFMITNEQGAMTTLHCATSEQAAEHSGLYWDKSALKRAHRLGRDDALAEELWRRSEAWVGLEPSA